MFSRILLDASAEGVAILAVLSETLVLTGRFVTSGLGFTAFAVALLFIAEYRSVRRTAGGNWWAALKDWRHQLSDGFVVFLYALVFVFVLNLFRAPLILWRQASQQIEDKAKTQQHTADEIQTQAQIRSKTSDFDQQLKSRDGQISQLQTQLKDQQKAFDLEAQAFGKEKKHIVLTNKILSGARLAQSPIGSPDATFPFAVKVVIQTDRTLPSPLQFFLICDAPVGKGTFEFFEPSVGMWDSGGTGVGLLNG